MKMKTFFFSRDWKILMKKTSVTCEKKTTKKTCLISVETQLIAPNCPLISRRTKTFGGFYFLKENWNVLTASFIFYEFGRKRKTVSWISTDVYWKKKLIVYLFKAFISPNSKTQNTWCERFLLKIIKNNIWRIVYLHAKETLLVESTRILICAKEGIL